LLRGIGRAEAKEEIMSSRSRIASFVAGIGIALGVGLPTAEGTAPANHQSSASAHMTAQALAALDARWNAEAEAYEKRGPV
jgi:hypothetical protein